MLKIGKPYLTNTETHTRLCADVSRDGEVKTLWFEVQKEFEKFLCPERSDAFVVGLLHYAMRKGHDIESIAPMTDRMYEQLTEQFLPAYFKINRMRGVRICCPVAPEVDHFDGEAGVGTGVSCGVDSMHVFAAHPEITHACIWNMHGVTADETDEKRALGWKNMLEQGKRFSDHIGVKLIVGDTNYDRGCFSDMAFDGSTTYGNLFGALALQKLWSKYYVASGYDIDDFSLTLGVNADPAHYEYVLFSFLSTAKLSLRIDGAAQNRIEKVGDLIKYEPSKKFLNVCWGIHSDGRNCSYLCPKCMRTMLNLDAWNALDDYAEVFDVKYYRQHFEQFLAELYRGYLRKSNFALEQRAYFRKKNIPLFVRVKAWRIVFAKILRKVLRGGATSHKFEPK